MRTSVRRTSPSRAQLVALACSLSVLVASCGGRSGGTEPGSAPGITRDTRNISFDPMPLYRQMGMIARGLPFPITGRVGYFAAPRAAQTHVVLTLSFASSSLTFSREADNRFRANYSVSLAIDNEQGRVQALESTEAVVVSSFRETGRTDESVLFLKIGSKCLRPISRYTTMPTNSA